MQEIKKGWKKVKFGDVIISNPKISLKKGNIYSFIEMQSVSEGCYRSVNNIDKKEFNGGTKFEEGDILFSRITPCLQNGKIAQVKGIDVGFGSTEYFIFRNIEGITDNKFLFYRLIDKGVIDIAIKSMVGASGRQRADIKSIQDLEILLPPLSTQQKIASILSKYDDLIENNNKRINILEETAGEIYEEWFVKYNFPGNENIKMIESGNDDFGMIPEGWEVRSILDIDYFRFIRENLKEYEGEKVYYATADIDGICITGKGENFDFNSKLSRAQKEPILNSVWFARMIETFKLLGFTQTNKEIANRSILSSGMVGFEAEEFIFPFLYYTINSKDFHSIKNLYCTGATQRALTNDGLKQIKVIYPNKNIVENYGKLTKSMIDEMFLLQKQNQNLKETRDLLIPRLVSGELDVESLDVKI